MMQYIRCLAGLLVLVLPHPVLAAVTIAISPVDDRQYRYVRLDNGLKVVLVSDPGTRVAAASLDVHVGSGADPKERQGLAHFLEHMLFLGTKSYPQPGEYAQFVTANAGSQNAYTSYDHTNYHFEVQAAALAGALSRFARFFDEPLFDARYVQRERQVVQAEFASKQKSDAMRGHEAFKQALNPQHPMTRFSSGSLHTLRDRPGDAVRDDLIAFFRQHYHAGNMSLALIGRQSLDQLEALVLKEFSAIPMGKARQAPDIPLFLSNALPARLDMTPAKERRRLTLTFPMPPLLPRYKSKPLYYAANILGHEGVGSLLSTLRSLGLAEGLSAGIAHSDRREAMFDVSIALTPAGLSGIDRVIGLVFRYIDVIRTEPRERWRFEEAQRLAALNFRFMERGGEGALARALAHNLHAYPPEDVLRGPYAFDEFNAEHIEDTLERLTPDNVLVRVMAPGLSTDAVTAHFRTPYKLRAITAQEQAAWAAVRAPAALGLPQANPYIAEDLALLDENTGEALPEVLERHPGFTLWHAPDVGFARPLASFYVSVRSPLANRSPREAALTALLVSMVNEQLREPVYPAGLAGLDVSVYRHLRGFSFRVHGYNDKLAVLVDEVLEAIAAVEMKPRRFARVKERLRRHLANARLDAPYTQAMAELRNVLLEPHWSKARLLDALEDIELTDLDRFYEAFFSRMDSIALAHGNIDAAQASGIGRSVHAALLAGRERVTVPRAHVVRLHAGEVAVRALQVAHDDVAVVRYIQGRERSYRERAAVAMLAQLLRSPFYSRLRTEEQLGYAVFAGARSVLRVPGLMFVVQSPTAPLAQLSARIDAFMESFATDIAAVDPARFNRQRDGLIERLLEDDRNLRDRTNRFWRALDDPNIEFDRRQKFAKALQATDLADVRDVYRELLRARSTGSVLVTAAAPGNPTGGMRSSLEPESFRQPKSLEGVHGPVGASSPAIIDVPAFKRAHDLFAP